MTLKLAYFSPLNPVQSGISDYSEDLLPYLAHYAHLDLFVDSYTPNNPAITDNFAIKSGKYNPAAYDASLFHMGNSAAHAYIYQALKKEAGRGILVLHEYVLHHFFIGLYLNHGKALEYIRLMKERHGAEGEHIAREVIKGRFAEVLFQYPLCEEAIEASRAVLVHSQYAKNLIQARYPDKQVGVARMGVPLPPLLDKQTARAELGLPPDQFIITSQGHINPYKRLDSALWAFRAFRREYPNSRYILVGSPSPNYDVKAMITALGLEKHVELVGYTDGTRFQTYLAAADVCVNLRYPSAGETSASLLRIMGAGRPVLVSRTGSFEELPDDACIKVDVDDAEEELIFEYLRLLAREPALRATIGANARRYVAQHARLTDAAHDYYLFLCRVLGRTPEITQHGDTGTDLPANPLPKKEGEQNRVTLPSFSGNVHTVGGSSASDTRFDTSPAVSQPKAPDAIMQEVAQAAAEIGIDESDHALTAVAHALKFIQAED